MSEATSKHLVEEMEKLCIGMATGGANFSYEKYEDVRGRVMSDPVVLRHLPKWLVECRSGSQFWQFIKEKYSTYAERRKFIWSEFAATLKGLERVGIDGTADSVEIILSACTAESVHDAWQKCVERRATDPEGAITSARTMVEATCKIILDRLGEKPANNELQKLYKQAAKSLRLAPDQFKEDVFKQILTGCVSAVDGLACMRNALGDAHGQGANKIKPSRRHAELAINLAGTLCTFLMATYEERQRTK